jgi:hypothetical protein
VTTYASEAFPQTSGQTLTDTVPLSERTALADELNGVGFYACANDVLVGRIDTDTLISYLRRDAPGRQEDNAIKVLALADKLDGLS